MSLIIQVTGYEGEIQEDHLYCKTDEGEEDEKNKGRVKKAGIG